MKADILRHKFDHDIPEEETVVFFSSVYSFFLIIIINNKHHHKKSETRKQQHKILNDWLQLSHARDCSFSLPTQWWVSSSNTSLLKTQHRDMGKLLIHLHQLKLLRHGKICLLAVVGPNEQSILWPLENLLCCEMPSAATKSCICGDCEQLPTGHQSGMSVANSTKQLNDHGLTFCNFNTHSIWAQMHS